MAAVATGGFSSHDEGIGHFRSPAIEWTATVLMLFSAMPYVLHLQALRRGPDALFRDEQVRLFLWITSSAIASLFVWRIVWNEAPMLDAIREAAFNVLSTISTTGFTSPHQDHAQWGGFPAALLLLIMLVGGCTGSTAGGIKMFRIRVLLSASRASAPADLSAWNLRHRLQRNAGNRFRPRRCHPLFFPIPLDIYAVRARSGLLWHVV